jgi:cytidine deaminase
MNSPIPWKALIEAAERARANAYAPYSQYQVGAAILTADGRIFAGCNVENATYGLTLCAERSAVAQLIASGARDMVALAVVTRGPDPGPPCGLCRQTLSEFATDLPIGLALPGDSAPRVVKPLSELFPEPFRGDLVKGP